jgi:putative endonuclease
MRRLPATRSLIRFAMKRFLPIELGRAGEKRAAWFYRLRGFRILARNYRGRDGEIDLIVQRGSLLVFVEVKTRQQRHHGAPHEAVDRAKQLTIARLAQEWCHRERRGERNAIRFDVVSLYWNGWRFELEHFPDAFELRADVRRPWITR